MLISIILIPNLQNYLHIYFKKFALLLTLAYLLKRYTFGEKWGVSYVISPPAPAHNYVHYTHVSLFARVCQKMPLACRGPHKAPRAQYFIRCPLGARSTSICSKCKYYFFIILFLLICCLEYTGTRTMCRENYELLFFYKSKYAFLRLRCFVKKLFQFCSVH